MCINYIFISATEAHDHDGLPHTLEHLVFMGSEKYPYKVKRILSKRDTPIIIPPFCV